jgi:Phage integrase, N-terminal SAM-like domain
LITPHYSACLLGMVNRSTIEETSMMAQFCPNPVVLQRLFTGPLRTHIAAVGQPVSRQGYTSATATYTMRLLADLSNWLQQHALTAVDCNAQLASDFLPDRYRRRRPHRHDRAALRRWLEHLRDQGVIPIPVVETDTPACDSLVGDFQHYLLSQRCLAPTTADYYLDTVQRFLRERFGTQPLDLEALCPQDITRFMMQQARCYSPSHAKLFATALRSFCRFLLQRGAIAYDLAQAVPTVPNWRLSALPKFMKAEDVDCLLHSVDRKCDPLVERKLQLPGRPRGAYEPCNSVFHEGANPSLQVQE